MITPVTGTQNDLLNRIPETEWVTRKDLAEACGKNQLSPAQLGALDRLVKMGLVIAEKRLPETGGIRKAFYYKRAVKV